MQLILGTAQIGLNYGIMNKNDKPTIEDSLKIIDMCIKNKIEEFDTAHVYGDSEYILGIAKKQYKNIKIITKLPHMELSPIVSSNERYLLTNQHNEKIKQYINSMKKNLDCEQIDVLLLHDFINYLNPIIWNNLLNFQKEGSIKYLGCSIYYVDQAKLLLKNKNIKYIQLPFNILSDQWFDDEFLKLLKKRTDVKIHIRSIFLQGLLISDIENLPNLPSTITDTLSEDPDENYKYLT